MKLLPLFAAAFLSLLAQAANTPGATAGFTRKVLQDQDISAAGHHSVVAQIDFAAGAAASWHRYPGEEIDYVVAGTVAIEIDGKRAQTLKAGDSFFVPAGLIHTARHAGGRRPG